MKKTLYIIDIFSFIFRAYYAIRPLSAPDGTPVNAVYGVITMLKRLIDEHGPDHVVVCMDSKDGNFRNEIFPEYKANRGEPPEDLIPQIGLIEEYIKTIPLLSLKKQGFEADDIIATLVDKYEDEENMQIFIVSSDKDLMQLVSDKKFVSLYDTMKNKVMKEKDVQEKFGVGPDRVIDIQSLCGDSVDNIPGISGVGPKTAAKLINEYGTLEKVLDSADELKGKLSEKVANGRDDALISKELVTLRKDVPLKITWRDLELKEPNTDKLNEFYKRLNFTSLVTESGSTEPKEKQTLDFQTLTLNDAKSLEKVLQDFLKKKNTILAFDTETTSKDSITSDLVGFSFCFDQKKSYYVPLNHSEGKNLDFSDFQEIMGSILSDEKIKKVAQNAKYDINVLSRYGLSIKGLQDDTLVASYLSDPEGMHSLDALALRHLGHENVKFSDIVEKGKTFADVPIEEATKYAAEDSWATLKLLDMLKKNLKELNLTEVYDSVEIPLISVLSEMELTGILVDQKLLKELKKDFEARLQKLEKEIYKLAGEEFNINSPKQLAEILFIKLGLPPQKKTKTGFSTDVRVLETLSHEHDLPKFLLEFRQLTKLNSTYVEQLNKLINPETQRIHTSFNQAIVATGRLSSTDPNLQNIPIKTEEGRKIREVFIAPKGSSLFSADYSQIELRLLAAFTDDPELVHAYQNDEDIHKKTAAKIFSIEFDDVTSEMRGIGKTINFGVIYGQSPFGLSKQLGVPQSEAKRFIEGFYNNYAKVKDYREEILEQAREQGYVSTYLGRRRYIREIKSKNFMARQNSERVAFNTVFQGSAADLIKKAMIQIAEFLQTEKLKTKMLLQVHDELIFEVPDGEQEIIQKNIPKIMESVFDLSVPLKVSSAFGQTWGEAH